MTIDRQLHTSATYEHSNSTCKHYDYVRSWYTLCMPLGPAIGEINLPPVTPCDAQPMLGYGVTI